MAYEHKPGTFTLFKNDKGDNDKRPDYRGEGKDASGGDIEVSAWIKEGGKGKFLSCTMKPKGTRIQTPAADKKAGKPSQMDDDIPFAPIGRSHAL